MLLDKRRQKSDKCFNIIFRITHNRKVYTLNSGVAILEVYWNGKRNEIDKSHPNANLLNLKISKQYFDLQKSILQLEEEFSIEKLKKIVSDEPEFEQQLTFKKFTEDLISQLVELNKTGNALVYQTALNQFMLVCDSDNLMFPEIDYVLIEKFSNCLLKKGLKQNSISNYLRTIRAIYNKAIKQKIVDRSLYPFSDFTIKSEKTIKRAVLKEEIRALMCDFKLNWTFF